MARSMAGRLAALAGFMGLMVLVTSSLLALQIPFLLIYPLTAKPDYGRRQHLPTFVQRLREQVPPEWRARFRWVYRSGIRFTEGLWASFVLVFMNLFAATPAGAPKVVVQAPPGVLEALYKEKDPVLTGNHQSLLDWIYAWIVAAKGGRGPDLKIFLKADIGNIPLIGNGIRNFELVLLRRDWQSDRRSFDRYMDLIRTDACGYWTLIYAEGTTIVAETLEKSRAYAEKQGVPHPFQASLMPRAMGLYSVLRHLAKDPPATRALYLVAQAYSPLAKGKYAWDEYTPAKVFFGGEGPASVEWRVWRFPVEEIPGIAGLASAPAEEPKLIRPNPERPGLRSRPAAAAVSPAPTPTLTVIPPSENPSDVDDEPPRGRSADVATPPARGRSPSPSASHDLPPEEAARLDAFAAWLTDRWLEIDLALRSFSETGKWGDEKTVRDLEVVGSRAAELVSKEIVAEPGAYDLATIAAAVLATYVPLMRFVAWVGVPLLWQLGFFGVLVGGVTVGAWAVGVLS